MKQPVKNKTSTVKEASSKPKAKRKLPPGRKKNVKPMATKKIIEATNKKEDTTIVKGYVVYDLKKIAHAERMHPNHNAAVDALTRAFAEGKRIAIKESAIPISKIPNIWIAMADYVEIDGQVIKSRDGKQIKV